MKLTDKIHVLPINFEIVLNAEKKIPRLVNVILILGERITLIDTGVKGCETLIFDYIQNQNRHYSEIDSIILSHSHPDHIGSAAAIQKHTNCKIYAHKLEKEWIENVELQNEERPVPGFFNLVDKSVKVDEFITDGQKIQIQEGLTLKFAVSPGHSKGSLNILFEEDKIFFTADSIPLKNDIPNYDNYVELMNSLEYIKKQNFTSLLSSWTKPLLNNEDVKTILTEGEQYMKKIDYTVKECYIDSELNPFESCRLVVEKLGMPSFFVNPIVDKAFRSHFKYNSLEVYLLADMEIMDEVAYSKYAKRAEEIIPRFGGEYIVNSANTSTFSGDWNPDKIVLIKFPSIEKLNECFASEEYNSIKHIREKSTKGKAIIMEV